MTATWQNAIRRREFFDNFAKEKGFDALKPESWYPLAAQFKSIKVF
jgi:hypothetical protein